MSLLLGADAALRANADAGGAVEGAMSPSEKRRMSNPALGERPGVIEVEVQEAAVRAKEETVGSKDQMQRDFVELCEGAISVICCRMSPSQKGRMVLLMRRLHPELCSLAIGDGANDVNMIQSANIGIGVRGKEGMQAVLASDYAITRFRFLLPLLLVHGHWNYRRQSKTILYCPPSSTLTVLTPNLTRMFQVSLLQEHVLRLHAVLAKRDVRLDHAADVQRLCANAVQRAVLGGANCHLRHYRARHRRFCAAHASSSLRAR